MCSSLPSVEDVDAIVAIRAAALRNIRITHAYHLLAAGMAPHTAGLANWCTFATWASRQAGQTIRGEDLLETLRARLLLPARWLHPIHSLWRRVLAAGLYDRHTRLGRLVHAIQGPLDPFERASDAVARGNRKVFEEIGREFARFLALPPGTGPHASAALQDFLDSLRDGPPPEGQRLLKQAFARYAAAFAEPDAGRRAQAVYLANLEIGWHEQARLQPEIEEALDPPLLEMGALGRRVLDALVPGAADWPRGTRAPVAWLLAAMAWPFARAARALAREVVTDCLMTLRLPGDRVAWLGHHLDLPFAQSLARIDEGELSTVLAGFQCGSDCLRACGADDWGALEQRMHYIAHLFRACHEDRTLAAAPFTPDQVASLMGGRLPDGTL